MLSSRCCCIIQIEMSAAVLNQDFDLLFDRKSSRRKCCFQRENLSFHSPSYSAQVLKSIRVRYKQSALSCVFNTHNLKGLINRTQFCYLALNRNVIQERKPQNTNYFSGNCTYSEIQHPSNTVHAQASRSESYTVDFCWHCAPTCTKAQFYICEKEIQSPTTFL